LTAIATVEASKLDTHLSGVTLSGANLTAIGRVMGRQFR
jgi:hypothetical protein